MLSSPTVDSFKQAITFKTLQSDDRGIFKTFLQGLKGSGEPLEETPGSALDSATISYLSPSELYTRKNEVEAEDYRRRGNEAFKASRVMDAFRSYSLGIFKASEDSDVLTKLYGNRSACLFRLGHFKEAVTDIDEALSSQRSSKDFIDKLKERRKDCLVKETVELQEAGAPKIKSKLSIVYGGTSVGRFVSASEAINTGESILSESPVGSVLYPEQRGSHCAVCFLRLIAGYPCPTCSNIAFCSPSCREKGSFHEFECRYDDFLRGLGLSSIGRLALRLITSQPLEYFLKIKEHLKASNETEESLSQHGYINIYNLTGNGDQRWREDRVHRSYLSAILTKVLLCSGYFKSTQSVKEDTRYICELLCRYMEILQFNAHEVYEFIRKDKRALKPSKQAPIGLAIYQKASYFNHSCFGSIVRYFEGNIMHLRALHPIEVGEEVYENYGPTFYFKGTSERQRDLRHRYWFDCRCGPCTHKWPLLKSLPSSEKISSFYHNELNQESFKDLSAFIEKHFRPSSGGGLPSEILVRAMDKLRTVSYNMGSTHYINK